MLLKSITIVNCIVILGIRYFNMGNEVSNVAVSRKSVSAEATGKPESDEKLYKFRNPTLVRSQRSGWIIAWNYATYKCRKSTSARTPSREKN